MRQWAILTLIFAMLQLSTADVFGIDVKQLRATTDDGVVVTVWRDQPLVKFGQDMVFHYTVKNYGSKPLYLVTEKKPKITPDGADIGISADIPHTGEYDEYSFIFHRVGIHGTYIGQFRVPVTIYKIDQLWRVHFGFAYVFDKSGLDRARRPGEGWLILSGGLMEKSRVVKLASLDLSTEK